MTTMLERNSSPPEPSGAPDSGGRRARHEDGAIRQPIKLIYIVGYGRSGTTLLDIALGQQPSIMGAGEIATLARHVWDNDEFCACGVPVSRCEHWSQIVARWREGETAGFLSRYRRAQLDVESILAPRRLVGGSSRSEYARSTAKLLRAIADVSGRQILVDSSKLPGRGFASAELPGIDMYVIHVVRDGRGVAWSMGKGHKREVEKGVQRELRPKWLPYTASRWAFVNIAADLLCRKVGKARSMRVRYEDFVADPDGMIDHILTFAGEPRRASSGHLAGEMVPQHQVAGSRHRMAKSLIVKKDETWKSEMPAYRQMIVTMICAPLLKRYGYSLGPA